MAVHRHIKNPKEHPQPYELTVARVCQAYQVMPTRAMWEIEHDPDGMVFTVMTIWAFERTMAQIDAAKDEKDMPKGPMADLVLDIDSTSARESAEAAVRKALEEADEEDEDADQ